MVEDRNDKSGTKSEQIERPKEVLPLQEPGQIAGVLKELPKEVLSEVLKKLPVDQVSVVKASAYSGPLPPPGMLEAYNKAVPNAAERILKSFEKQQEHRMQLEENMMDKNFDAAKRGQYMGLSISIARPTNSGSNWNIRLGIGWKLNWYYFISWFSETVHNRSYSRKIKAKKERGQLKNIFRAIESNTAS